MTALVHLDSARDDAVSTPTALGLQALHRGLLGNNGRGCGWLGVAADSGGTMATRRSESECCPNVGLERGVDFLAPKEPCCASWLDLEARLLAVTDPPGLFEDDERRLARGRLELSLLPKCRLSDGVALLA
jgi:hypothetical protein